MAKIVDISEKLSFDENPILKIGDLEVEVNSDAETMLKLMGTLDKGESMSAVKESMELLFEKGAVEKICSLKDKKGKKLSASSLSKIVETAIELVVGNNEGGLGPDTALGRIVSIRAEDRKEMLEQFTSEQMRIRSEWQSKWAKQMAKTNQQHMDAELEAIRQGFLQMAGIKE